MAEYLVFSVPLLVLLVIFGQYVPLLIYPVLLLVISFVRPSPKGVTGKTYHAWVKHIPAGMYEWQSGIRISLPGIVPFYGLGLAGVFNIWLSVTSFILLSLTFGSFYGPNE